MRGDRENIGQVPPHLPPCVIPYSLIYAKRPTLLCNNLNDGMSQYDSAGLTLSPQSLGESEREEIFFAKAEFIADAAARGFSVSGSFLLMPLLS